MLFREWGDQPELVACSEIYARPVEVYAYKAVPHCTINPSPHVPPIRVSFHFQSHYRSVVFPPARMSYLRSTPGEVEARRVQVARVLRAPGSERSTHTHTHKHKHANT
jgi:hypothetical protein